MDWTRSAYIAAFFAFRTISTSNPTNSVRIFAFDEESWKNEYPQLGLSWAPWYHFSILQPVAIDNNRAIPQQAVSTVTNVRDIENYIKIRENQKNNQYLWRIDLPVSQRIHALKDLSSMGITAASMMPGLDGSCEELKARSFGY